MQTPPRVLLLFLLARMKESFLFLLHHLCFCLWNTFLPNRLTYRALRRAHTLTWSPQFLCTALLLATRACAYTHARSIVSVHLTAFDRVQLSTSRINRMSANSISLTSSFPYAHKSELSTKRRLPSLYKTLFHYSSSFYFSKFVRNLNGTYLSISVSFI